MATNHRNPDVGPSRLHLGYPGYPVDLQAPLGRDPTIGMPLSDKSAVEHTDPESDGGITISTLKGSRADMPRPVRRRENLR